jgi:hypothetical protein
MVEDLMWVFIYLFICDVQFCWTVLNSQVKMIYCLSFLLHFISSWKEGIKIIEFLMVRGVVLVTVLCWDCKKLLEPPCINSIEWSKWHVVWVDERVVPKDHEDSSLWWVSFYGMIVECFLISYYYELHI